jgi:hypothetical protein
MLEYIEITDDDFDEILSTLGFPFLTLEEDFLEIDKANVIKFIIKPALRDYYMYNPIKSESSHAVVNTFSIDFPDENVFNAIHCSLNQNYPYTGLNMPQTNPYVNAQNWRVVGYKGGGAYGMNRAYIYKYTQAISNGDVWGSVKHKVDLANRKLTGYTNLRGYLNVIWVSASSDFSNIRFDHKNDVIKYCQGKLKTWLGNLHSLQTSNLANEIDWDALKTSGQEMEDEVIEKWRKKTKPIIMSN